MARLLIDLYCGAGIGADGYASYFDIVGVDKYHQPRNPYEFVQMDALKFLNRLIRNDLMYEGRRVSVIHASPPCMENSSLRFLHNTRHPQLIIPTRERLELTGLPYVIENTYQAMLYDPIVLCGTMFEGLRVIRHRLFESNVSLTQPYHIEYREHPQVYTIDKRRPLYGKLDEWTNYVTVTGGGNCSLACAIDAMGIMRSTRVVQTEVVAAIPPAYTDFVGRQLVALTP